MLTNKTRWRQKKLDIETPLSINGLERTKNWEKALAA